MTDLAHLEIKADSSSVRTASTDLTNMSMASKGLTSALKLLLPAITAVLSIQAFKKMAVEAKEFGAAIGEVSTLLDDLTQMPRIESEARALAQQFGGTATSQAKAFYQAISAGAANAADATDILTAANRLAVGGVTDVETAVDGLTTLINSYGMETSQATQVSDALFVAMRAGKTTIGEMSDAVGRVSALASSAGVELDELLSATAALTAGGIKTTEAMSGMKAMLSNILKPSQDARDTAEALGIAFDGQALQAQGLQGFLENLIDKTGGSQEAMVRMFGSVEALNTVFALTGGGAETFADTMESMGDKAGQTEIAFDKMSNTMDFKLEQLSGKFGTARIAAGEFFLELLEPHVDQLNENFDNYVAHTSAVVTEFQEMSTSLGIALNPYGEDVHNLLTQLDEMWDTYFGNVEIGHLNMLEVLELGVGSFLINMRTTIQLDTVYVVNFFDEMITKMKMARASQEELDAALAMKNRVLEQTIDDLTGSYNENLEALFENIRAGQKSSKVFDEFEGKVEDTTTAFGELNDENFDAWMTMMGFKDEVVEATAETEELTATTRTAAEANEILQGTVEESTLALELQKNMVENVQREWGNLIYDLLDEGKFRFKDFFDAILDGYKRMVAEMLAQNLAQAIFGGQGLGGLTGGLAGLLGGGGSAAAGAAGGGILGGIGGAVSGAVSGIGGWLGGLFGGGGAAASGTMVSTGAGGLTAMGASGGAGLTGLLTNPWTIGIGALLIGMENGWWSDPDGYKRTMAGMLVAPTPGANAGSTFAVNPFASGFTPTGFADGTSQADAMNVINSFRSVDQTIFDLVTGAGGSLDLSRATLAGLGVDATSGSSGTFLGLTPRTDNFEGQLDMFAAQLVRHIEGLSPEVMARLMGASSTQEIVDILGAAATSMDNLNSTLQSHGPRMSGSAIISVGDDVVDVDKNDVSMKQMMSAMIMQQRKTTKVLKKFDVNGLPPERS